MPIYDYLCTACDHRADILHGINDPRPRYCPSCGAEGTMRKQFAAPAIHFKGSGWAKKDRGASSATRAAAKADAGDKGDKVEKGDKGDKVEKGSGSAPDASPTSSSTGSSSTSSASSESPKPSTTD